MITVKPDQVVVTAVVRDRKGALVGGLTKDDFVLKSGRRSLDSAKAQGIEYFDHGSDVPLTLGLVVDVSRGMKDKLEEEKAESQMFLDSVLQPASGADKVFVVQFAKQIEMLEDVTAEKPKWQKALTELGTEDAQFHNQPEPDTTDAEGRKVRGGGTALYDAVFLSGDEVLSKVKGRKVLVVLTDGVDVGSKESLTDTIEAAQRADMIVYAVYFKSEQHFEQTPGNNRSGRTGGYPGGGGGYPGGGGGYPGGYPGGGGNNPNGGGSGSPSGTPSGTPSRKPSVDGKQVMERLCGETGGRVFEVSKKQSIDDVYKQIAEELRSEYRLGFTPDEAAAREGYHQIDLSLKDPDKNKKLDVQVRAGYYVEDGK